MINNSYFVCYKRLNCSKTHLRQYHITWLAATCHDHRSFSMSAEISFAIEPGIYTRGPKPSYSPSSSMSGLRGGVWCHWPLPELHLGPKMVPEIPLPGLLPLSARAGVSIAVLVAKGHKNWRRELDPVSECLIMSPRHHLKGFQSLPSNAQPYLLAW